MRRVLTRRVWSSLIRCGAVQCRLFSQTTVDWSTLQPAQSGPAYGGREKGEWYTINTAHDKLAGSPNLLKTSQITKLI